MLVRQVADSKLAQFAYLIGCPRTGDAIIIDPERDVDRYFELAARHRLRIVAAADTHIHADYLSGLREMAARGLKIMVNSDDPSMFHTDIGTEYVKMANAAQWGVDTVRELSLNGIDGSWLSDDEKRRKHEG